MRERGDTTETTVTATLRRKRNRRSAPARRSLPATLPAAVALRQLFRETGSWNAGTQVGRLTGSFRRAVPLGLDFMVDPPMTNPVKSVAKRLLSRMTKRAPN